MRRTKHLLGTASKTIGRWAGFEISRYRPFDARVARRLETTQVPLVIDVGANRGQYARALRKWGYRGEIVSFEPLPAAFATLAAAAAHDDSWTCHAIALGDHERTADLHVATNLASSSLLEMADAHRQAAPTVSVESHEQVRVARLDDLLGEPRPCLLKLDVQGYEDRVLDGAPMTLGHAVLVECELSLATLYHGQASARRLIERLDKNGFDLVDLNPFFYDPGDGRVLSFDGLFARRIA